MKHIKIIFLIGILILFSSPSYSTETLLINEISQDIIREVFSSKKIIDQINKLVQENYTWTEEFIHVGSEKIRTYYFTLFFEKQNDMKALIFSFDPLEKKIFDVKLLTKKEYLKMTNQ